MGEAGTVDLLRERASLLFLSLFPKRSVGFKLGCTLKLLGGLCKNIPSQFNVLTLGNA